MADILGFGDLFIPPSSSKGGGEDSSRYKEKAKIKEIKQATLGTEFILEGAVRRLLGNQSGVGGFTLSSLTHAAGTVGGTAGYVTIKDQSGTTKYIQTGTSVS